MPRTRWFCLAAAGLLFSFAVLAPPHTVHHGLHARDLNDCPVLAAAHQTSGDLPETLSLPIPLLATYDVPVLRSTLPQTPARRADRTRAPPFNLST